MFKYLITVDIHKGDAEWIRNITNLKIFVFIMKWNIWYLLATAHLPTAQPPTNATTADPSTYATTADLPATGQNALFIT